MSHFHRLVLTFESLMAYTQTQQMPPSPICLRFAHRVSAHRKCQTVIGNYNMFYYYFFFYYCRWLNTYRLYTNTSILFIDGRRDGNFPFLVTRKTQCGHIMDLCKKLLNNNAVLEMSNT